MKRKYSIGFFVAVVFCMVFLIVAYQAAYNHAKAEYKAKQNEENKKQESIATKGIATKNDGYYLIEENGYVTVYLGDRETLFELTNIKIELLPKELQKEVACGKKISTLEELYGFLENYSS